MPRTCCFLQRCQRSHWNRSLCTRHISMLDEFHDENRSHPFSSVLIHSPEHSPEHPKQVALTAPSHTLSGADAAVAPDLQLQSTKQRLRVSHCSFMWLLFFLVDAPCLLEWLLSSLRNCSAGCHLYDSASFYIWTYLNHIWTILSVFQSHSFRFFQSPSVPCSPYTHFSPRSFEV